MKDVLLSNAGVQVYIIDGSRRTDAAARAVITALYNAGRVCKEAAERAWSDRATLDKIKRNMLHVQMEERETETGKRWTFYTAGFVYMDIPAYSRNYITADKNGLLYSNQDTQNAPTETAQKTADDTTTAGSDTDRTEASQDAEKTIRTGARLYSHPHRHMVTVEGLQEGLVMVVYRGRLYLVSRGDLYTDETETTPAILPAEAAQPAAVIPMENDTTSATATTGRECTQQAAQDAQSTHRATKAHRAIQGHAEPHKRPYRATQRAAKSIMRNSPTTATGRRPAEKSHFLAGMGSAKILGQGNHPPPILTHFFVRFLKRFLPGQKSAGGTGVQKSLANFGAKIFRKNFMMEGMKMGRFTCRAIDENEYRKVILLLRTGYEHNGVKHRPNDQIATILVLQANLGCRIGDIMNLTTDSIIKDGSIHRLNIVEQKTGKKRTFIVPQPVVDFIEDYKKHTPIGADGKLFDIGAHAVRKQLRAVTSYIGIENCSTHSFRKKFSCDLYERTNHDIMAVCQALQHASTKTTMTYIKRSDAQIEAAMNQVVSIA